MNDLIEQNKNYGFNEVVESHDSSMVHIEQSRAAAEVQSSFIIAKRFPRDENKAFSKIMKSCERPFLAEAALYAYPKGGTVVTGPSIRLAEVLIQNWGNCDAGIREISQSNGVSVAEAYAIDLESNTRITKIFHVPHERFTKKGKYRLTDPREIYELVANQGARRMRACILGIIPGDIIEASVEKIKSTLSSGKEPIQDRIRKLIVAFEEFGIKVDQIEKRLGHKLDAIIESELITLRAIYKSLKDGMAKREDFFDLGFEKENQVSETIDNLIANKNTQNVTTQNDETKETKSAEYSKVKKALQSAKSIDTLNLAADLIRECDEKHQAELTAIFHDKKSQLS